MDDGDDDMVSTGQLCEMSSTSRSTINRARARGDLKSYKIGRSVRYIKREARAWMTANQCK
jgi:predicted DNA-binding transcriptional regulator AlpA